LIACSYRNFLYRFRSSITFAALCSKMVEEKSGSIQGLWGRCSMWIFVSYYKGFVELWGRERGLTRLVQPIHLHSTCIAISIFESRRRVLLLKTKCCLDLVESYFLRFAYCYAVLFCRLRNLLTYSHYPFLVGHSFLRRNF